MFRCSRGVGYVDDKSIERLSVLFPQLSSVELHLCSLTDSGLTRFCVHNHRPGGLYRLVVDHAGDITDSAVMTMADHSPSLQQFILARCPAVTNTAVRSVSACFILSMTSSCR